MKAYEYFQHQEYMRKQKHQLTQMIDEDIKNQEQNKYEIFKRTTKEGNLYIDGNKYHYTKKPVTGFIRNNCCYRITDMMAYPTFEYTIHSV